MPAIPEPSVLLCERCGYPIGGLDPHAPCPECGTPTADSLPEARSGSPWQRQPSWRTLTATTWLALRRPTELFRRIQPVRDRRTMGLLLVRLGVASAIIVLFWAGFNLEHQYVGVWYLRQTSGVGTLYAWGAMTDALLLPQLRPLQCCATFPAVFLALLFMTWIEVVGVQFFGRRRGWRVTPSIAWSVCAHAAVGWTLAAVLYTISPALLRACDPLLDMLPPSQAVVTCEALAKAIPALCFFAGMLVFETLVYVGIRACRFANTPAAVAPTR